MHIKNIFFISISNLLIQLNIVIDEYFCSNKDQGVEECDATGDAINSTVWLIKKFFSVITINELRPMLQQLPYHFHLFSFLFSKMQPAELQE